MLARMAARAGARALFHDTDSSDIGISGPLDTLLGRARRLSAVPDTANLRPSISSGILTQVRARAVPALLALSIANGLMTGGAFATENSATTGFGDENFFAGFLPPPGAYWLTYQTYYTSGRINGPDGRQLTIPGLRLDAVATVQRFVYVANYDPEMMEGLSVNPGFQLVTPFVYVNLRTQAASTAQGGVGDVIFGPFLGWHYHAFNWVTALDIAAPSGEFRRTGLANIGRNIWQISPAFAISYGHTDGIDVSAKMNYDFNLRNSSATISSLNPRGAPYKSGEEFRLTYNLGYNFKFGSVGLGGYYYHQTSGDRIFDPLANEQLQLQLNGNRGEAFAAGPTGKMQIGPLGVSVSWQHEFFARNRPQGDRFWLRTVLRF